MNTYKIFLDYPIFHKDNIQKGAGVLRDIFSKYQSIANALPAENNQCFFLDGVIDTTNCKSDTRHNEAYYTPYIYHAKECVSYANQCDMHINIPYSYWTHDGNLQDSHFRLMPEEFQCIFTIYDLRDIKLSTNCMEKYKHITMHMEVHDPVYALLAAKCGIDLIGIRVSKHAKNYDDAVHRVMRYINAIRGSKSKILVYCESTNDIHCAIQCNAYGIIITPELLDKMLGISVA